MEKLIFIIDIKCKYKILDGLIYKIKDINTILKKIKYTVKKLEFYLIETCVNVLVTEFDCRHIDIHLKKSSTF